MNKGFADLRLTTWLWRRDGAVDETRTRDLRLGKATLYQLSYSRVFQRVSVVRDQSNAPTTSSSRIFNEVNIASKNAAKYKIFAHQTSSLMGLRFLILRIDSVEPVFYGLRDWTIRIASEVHH